MKNAKNLTVQLLMHDSNTKYYLILKHANKIFRHIAGS